MRILADFSDGDTRDFTNGRRQEERGDRQPQSSRPPQFGYRKITVERPLRLNFQASPERIERLEDEQGVPEPGHQQEEGPRREGAGRRGRAVQDAIRAGLAEDAARHALQGPGRVRAGAGRGRQEGGAEGSPAPLERPSCRRSRERDETAAICRDEDGNPEPDPDLRDTENVPLGEDVAGVLRARGEAARPRRLDRHEQSATRRTARSASSATRSTSTATSTATSRRGRWRRSRPTFATSNATSSHARRGHGKRGSE